MTQIIEENETQILDQLFRLWTKANDEILSTILNRKISFEIEEIADKEGGIPTPLCETGKMLIFPMTVSSGLLGGIYIVFDQKTLGIIVDLIIGGDGKSPPEEFEELHLNVLEEAINQLAGTMESILSDNLLRKINVRLGSPDNTAKNLIKSWQAVLVKAKLKMEGFPESPMEIVLPLDFSRDLTTQIEHTQNNLSLPSGKSSHQGNSRQNNSKTQGGQDRMYRKAMFSGLEENDNNKGGGKIDLLMDIPLELTVVLGKTRISFKELVDMGSGSIIELEKMAGEPSEVYVNGRLVGYGEIIVIEENFGVRMIETISEAASIVQGGKK